MAYDAMEPETVGNLVCRVVYDENPSGPWEWDCGASFIDPDGRGHGGDDLGRYWHDYYSDAETATRDIFRPLAIRETRGWVVYVTQAHVDLTGCPAELVGQMADENAALLGRYLDGEVYGYIVESLNGDHLDSCWGFDCDTDEVMDEAKAIAATYAPPSWYVDAYAAAARLAVSA